MFSLTKVKINFYPGCLHIQSNLWLVLCKGHQLPGLYWKKMFCMSSFSLISHRGRTMWPAALTLWPQTSRGRTRCVWASCLESKTTSPLCVSCGHPSSLMLVLQHQHFPFPCSCLMSRLFRCLCSITDTFENFTLSLLSSLMISGPNAPFYKALIEPKIGTDFSSVVGCVRD